MEGRQTKAMHDVQAALPVVTFGATDSKRSSPHIDAVKGSLEDAFQYRGKLPAQVLNIDGFSGKKSRFFLNNVVERTANPRYLEIGAGAGSTLCSAIHGNAVRSLSIDNWSQFGGPTNEFFSNISKSCSEKTKISIISNDFRLVRYDAIGKFNVYLYDGPHQYQDQYDALSYPLSCLDEQFIYIVDDWNWPRVRNGTFDAIRSLNLSTLFQVEIRTTLDDSHPPRARARQESDWHNGYFVAVLQRQS
jgi:hypothetical protein